MSIADLDLNKPDTANEDVPTCLQYEKETRQALHQSFRQEHHLEGPHKMPYGDTAARPAPGYPGRLYFNSEIRDIERDSGAGWIPLGFFNKRIRVVGYMGDGLLNKSLVGLGFAPKAVMIVPVSGIGDMVIRTNSFTANNSHSIGLMTTIPEGIVSLDADGFTVGITLNEVGVNYSSVCLTDL